MGIFIMVGMFVGALVVAGYAFATFTLPFMPLTPVVIGSLLLICGAILYFYKRRFWDRLE